MDSKMAKITNSGRAALAASIKQTNLFLALGVGDEFWGNEPPPIDMDRTTLVREVGRKIIDSVNFCVGDYEGSEVTPTGRFNIVEEPTNQLLCVCQFDFEDAVGFNIRELGIFVNTVVKPGLPDGQRYFLPDEIDDPGILLAIENIHVLSRLPSTREKLIFVLTF